MLRFEVFLLMIQTLFPLLALAYNFALQQLCHHDFARSMSTCSPTHLSQPLPERLLVGYANWAQCDEKIVQAVRNGLNVIIWFSINLAKDVDNKPVINGAIPNLECVARIANQLKKEDLNVIHLISVGGWNSPLPDASFSSTEWFRVLDDWNRNVVATAGEGWSGFHGIDWDPEGNDDTTKAENQFTVARMNLIGELSVLAKQNGYVVTMAPAQSYLDVFTSSFSLKVDYAPQWKPDFKYHGLNAYAYWLAKYGETELSPGNTVPTFDWIGLQLYEGWSHANHQIAERGVSVAEYLTDLIEKMHRGWTVEFSDEIELNFSSKSIVVPPSQLLIGLANGWTEPYPPVQKFLLLQPEQLEIAFRTLPDSLKPRGFMFWNIADEGHIVDGKPYNLATSLNKFLEVRAELG